MDQYTEEDKRDWAIQQVAGAPVSKKPEAIRTYAQFLKDVDFIFVDDNEGEDMISPVLDMFGIKNGNMCSVFSSNNLKVLNLDLLNLRKNKLYISYDVGMETQIVSYISRFIDGTLNKNLISVVEPLQIKRTLPVEINMDAYVFENCGIDKKVDDIEWENVWHAFYFYNLTMMDEVAAKKHAKFSTKEVEAFIEKEIMADKYIEQYRLCYCFLLKIVLLYFDNRPIKNKLLELINFENDDICTTDMMFINIAEAFWKQGTKISFFSKVQKGKKDILKVLKNMAWDLFHWVHASLNFNHSPNFDSDISIPLIYSIDRRFLELTQYTKIDCIAIDNQRKKSFPHHNEDVKNNYLSFIERLECFGVDALHKRNQNRKNVDTLELSQNLEKELLETNLFPL